MAVYFSTQNNIGFLTFDQPDSKVNVLTPDALRKLDTIITEVQGNKNIRALVITSRKKDIFVAGADIKEIEGITEKAIGEEKSRAGQDIFNHLEDLEIPTVAVIDGVALGGGLELALACQYRVATFNEKVKLGLPEVNLGIIPGFGGTYRLPRLVGLTQGLTMILTGKQLSGSQALKAGLVDRLFPQAGLENFVLDFVEAVKDKPLKKGKPRKRKKLPQRFLEDTFLGNYIVFSQARRNVLKQTKGFYPAPLRALDVVRRTCRSSRSRALQLEAKAFADLSVTDISKNLVSVFYLSEQAKKISSASGGDVQPQPVLKCGVVGAGVMGGGIAQILSYKDIVVRMKDINYEAVAQGLQAAYKVYRSAVKRRKLKRAAAEIKMAKISGTVDFTGFRTVDCVIEAVVENMDIKKKVFKELSEVVGDKAILCTNTSALSVSEIGSETKDPSRVVGFHFFNPVHRMPLVEIITTPETSKQTVATALGLVKRLGKTPVLVKDAPGFLVNRILLGYINEAGRILEEGGDIQTIDAVMTDFGMPMGPFTLSDEVGLDVGVKVLHILQEGLGERFAPVGIFDKIIEKKFFGKKNGKGFYIHGKKRQPNPAVLAMAKKSTLVTPKTQRIHQERMIFVMINEAARCLQEEVVDSAGAVDTGMIMGTGFPPFRGGLLRYADYLGADYLVERLERFAKKYNADVFTPSEYLKTLKAQGKRFYS